MMKSAKVEKENRNIEDYSIICIDDERKMIEVSKCQEGTL